MRKSPLKRKSKTTRAKLMAELDKLVSERTRERGYCQRCGSADCLQAHHIIRRSQSTLLRWDLRNLMCLCKKCHFWWHNCADTFDTEALRKKALTDDCNDFLNRSRKMPARYSIGDLEELLNNITEVK